MSTDLVELMQLTIDGQATPEQEAELRRLLAASEENRATFESLRAVAQQLDRVPLLDPPVRMVWRPASAGRRARARRYTRPLLAFAYAAAAVLIIVFAVHRSAPPSRTAGATMVRVESEDWPVVASATSVDATITIRGNGDEFVVNISSELPATIDWDRSKLSAVTGGTSQNQVKSIRLQRRSGATGAAVVRLQLPERPGLQATIDLR